MAASQQQKVDFLLKKIGYSASKTGRAEDDTVTWDGGSGSNTKKKPFAEPIPSPLVIPSTSIWSDSSLIPGTPPAASAHPVGIHTVGNPYRLTHDATVGINTRTFIARSTHGNQTASIDGNWIDAQFGAEYAVRVFKDDATVGSNELAQAGASESETWFFDYSSGILNFNGSTLPAGIGTDNIYLVGYRYTGGTGAKPPIGIGTFSSLYVTGISTFQGLVDINGGGQANTFKVEDLTAGRVVLAGTGGEIEDSANLTFNGATLNSTQLTVSGVTTTSGLVDINAGGQANTFKVEDLTQYRVVLAGAGGELQDDSKLTFDANSNLNVTGGLVVTGVSTLGSVGISTGLISGPATMYIDPATVGDNTGLLVIKGNLQVDGTQTTVNSSTMTVTDKNIVVAQGAANDAAADGGGITVKSGNGDKTWNWVDFANAWTSSDHIQVAAGKVFGFADDQNTYIDRPAADTIRFIAGGSERVRINTDGNTKITGGFNVTGISTFTGNIDANGDLDVDGYAELDDLNVSGITTSARLNVTGITTVATLNVGVSGQTLVGINTILDEDNMASNRDDALATQQSIKAYVDSNVTAQDLDFTGDTGSGQVDLDSQTFQLTGTPYEIVTTGAGQVLNVSLPDDVIIGAGLTVTSKLTVGTGIAVTTILDEDNMASDSATALASQQSIKKYVDDRSPAGPGGGNLAVSADSGSNQAINLNTEVLDIEGTSNEIETATGTNKVVIGLPDDVTIANDLTVASNAGIGSLSVTGISTFNDDVKLVGTGSSNVTWDKSDNRLEFTNNTKASFGTGTDLEIYSVGSGSESRILGTSGIPLRIGGDANNPTTISINPVYADSGIVVKPNSSVEVYFDGHQRFNTTGYGVSVSGFESIGIATFHSNVDINANADISGNLVVGAAGTTITTTVGVAASVGIGTANPAYMLDVAGAINSSDDVKINGTSVLTSALNEAVAMAIALG